jgi:hypothetical protein
MAFACDTSLSQVHWQKPATAIGRRNAKGLAPGERHEHVPRHDFKIGNVGIQGTRHAGQDAVDLEACLARLAPISR